MLKDNSQICLSLSPYQGLYDAIIPQKHLLRRIKENIDFSFVKHQCTRGYKRYKEMFQICRVEKSDFPLYFYILAGCAD